MGTALDLQDVTRFTATTTARAQGTVQDVDERTSYGGPPSSVHTDCSEKISFRPPDHAPVTFSSHGREVYTGEQCDPVHGTVTVLYDPRDPTHADTMASLESQYDFDVFYLIFLSLPILGGVVMLGLAILRRRSVLRR